MTRIEGTGSVRLNLPPATLLSVSPKGELALLLTEGREPMESSGTLARASALGGTPRRLLDGIVAADWAPDGEQLAILRNQTYDLEFPPGRILIPRVPVCPRFSPGGDRIAFIGAGRVHVVDRDGQSVLEHEFPWAFGLAWRPDGREIWFTGDRNNSGADRVLYAISLSGKRRLLAAAPGGMTIHDIAKDGTRALVASGAGWIGARAGGAHRSAESSLDLFGRSDLVGLSADGKQALLNENRAAGRGVYLRSTDGEETIRLSADLALRALGLSPDGRWALTWRNDDPAHLFMIPTDAGAPHQLNFDSRLRPGGSARWSPDGRRIFMALQAAPPDDGPPRIYRLESLQPVTPPGVSDTFAVSPDGRSIAALDHLGRLTIYPVDGGEPRTAAEERGLPIQWSADGKWLYLAAREPFRMRVYRRELASGRVESWRDIQPPDPAGLSMRDTLFLSSDGLGYAYGYKRAISVLYLVEGLH